MLCQLLNQYINCGKIIFVFNDIANMPIKMLITKKIAATGNNKIITKIIIKYKPIISTKQSLNKLNV